MSAPARFLDFAGPRVFTMPSGADFLNALAQGVDAAIDSSGPYSLSDAMILTPTRRAVRALSDALVQFHGGDQAVLLPRIRAIGDVDADEPPFEPGAIALDCPPSISTERRLFDLAMLIRQRLRNSGQNDAIPVALAEAEALARLIDEAHTEGVHNFDLVREMFREKLLNQPEHVKRAAQFLEIVMEYWPVYLQELGLSDPAAHRRFVLKELAQSWRAAPPSHMVIAAGSTGSMPATAELLGVIAHLPNGAVILPGLDMDLPDEDWKTVLESPGHPQHGLARLLNTMKIARAEVLPWPGAQEPGGARLRRRLVNEALLPAEATAGWSDRLLRLANDQKMPAQELVQKGLAGLSLIEADSEEEEAQVLALAIRHTLADPTKTAVLVTPDRALAERVRVALWRWKIKIDDSAGMPLDTTPLGVFLTLIAEAIPTPTEPVILASLLGSVLTSLGHAQAETSALSQMLEARYLRGVRRFANLEGLRYAIQNDEHLSEGNRAKLVTFTEALEAAFAVFSTMQSAPIATWAQAHAQAAEMLAQSDVKDGAAILWRGRAGDGAAAVLRALMQDAEVLGDVDAREYIHIFQNLVHQRPVRPEGEAQPRARILGPLEARMINADLVLLGGLNEGAWPSLPSQDPYLPRELKLELGLPDPERRLGLSAHDFAEHATKPKVLLTRAKRKGADPAIASRWLWRLKTLVRCAVDDDQEAEAALTSPVDYLNYARRLDQVPADAVHPAKPPKPKPPLNKRPHSLYVTKVKTLIRNPYGIYARYILGLKPLEALGGLPGPRERGIAIHDALEQFVGGTIASDDPKALPELANLMVEALRHHGFAEHQIPAEGARLKRAAEWFLHWQRERENDGWKPVMLEGQGEFSVARPGRIFTVKAKADRIDRRGDELAVLDYKTVAFPSPAEVYAGFDPQLPLEAAILEKKGFVKGDKTIQGCASSLGYIKISGGSKPGEFKALEAASKRSIGKAVTAEQFQARALKQLEKLIDWFDNPDHPYLCQPRAKYMDDYSDYDLLARRDEWDSTEEETGDGS